MIDVRTKTITFEGTLPFPKLMIDTDGIVVLFTKPNEGTVLNDGDVRFKTFTNHQVSYFKDYHGEVILTNSREL